MKKIIFVISSFGFGHLTRQLALKDSILKLSDQVEIVFVISESQEEIFSNAIITSSRVTIERIPLTPTIAMEKWDKVDVESSLESYQRFWEWETQIRDDRAWERILYGADVIINDIECVHNPIASKMGISIINISNFTWSDILEGIGGSEIAENYRKWESLTDLDIKLPLSLDCKSFSTPLELGFLVRTPNIEKIKKIKEFSEKKKILVRNTHQHQVKYLKQLVKELLNKGFTPIISEFLIDDKVFDEKSCVIIEKQELDTHNYYIAADLVISKLGYGTVSEVLRGGTPLMYWKRSGFIEDEELEAGLLQYGHGLRLPANISVSDLIERIETFDFISYSPIEDNNDGIGKLVLNHLNQE